MCLVFGFCILGREMLEIKTFVNLIFVHQYMYMYLGVWGIRTVHVRILTVKVDTAPVWHTAKC